MSNAPTSIWIGYDPREDSAFHVCKSSIKKHMVTPLPIYGIVLEHLKRLGLYTRPTEVRDGRLYDVISEAPMSTEFAISRFLVPRLARATIKLDHAGWALFMDCDMLSRYPLDKVFDLVDPKYAMMCVKHKHTPPVGIKMDGQEQQRYKRKNWSSFMLFNCDHPANDALTVEMVNSAPGRDLHRFCWLDDDSLIGELSPEWNWLVGHNDPKMVHFTEGGPWFDNYKDVPYADEWIAEQNRIAAGGLNAI